MGIIERALSDVANFTSNSTTGAAKAVQFTSPVGFVVSINCYHFKHHLGVDTDGNVINTRTANITFSEQVLLTAGYSIRDDNGVVNLNGHIIEAKDSTGTVRQYIIQTWLPDETIGLISASLEDFEGCL